ncbi:hypothetical protein Taro_001570 [Colocasia esculenta]|uniref:CCHC-type domain-containing protein n=1 Tax=Colocasia esculenta TaxID=4460 RepID=A0A843TGL2_COLES|nr:hypothetical protein [Colocasia esculenta]
MPNALKVADSSSSEDSKEKSDDSDDEAMLSRKLQRILAKKKKFGSKRFFKKDKKKEPTCYRCNQPRHYKSECPKLKKKDQAERSEKKKGKEKKFRRYEKKFRRYKKKAENGLNGIPFVVDDFKDNSMVSKAIRMKFKQEFYHEELLKYKARQVLSTAKKGLSTDGNRQSSGLLALCVSVDRNKRAVDRYTVQKSGVLEDMRLSTALGWLSTEESSGVLHRLEDTPSIKESSPTPVCGLHRLKDQIHEEIEQLLGLAEEGFFDKI